jgi:hypothetical protein
LYPLPPSLDGWEKYQLFSHPSKDGGNGYKFVQFLQFNIFPIHLKMEAMDTRLFNFVQFTTPQYF